MCCNRFISLFVLVATWTVLHAQINGDDYENAVIVTSFTQNPLTGKFDHINLIPGTLYDFEGESLTYTYLGLQNFNTKILSVDVNYDKRRLYIFNSNTATLFALEKFDWENTFASIDLTVVHDGLSRYSTRLSVDWVADNIYWTDPLFGWIVVQSGSKKDIYKILIKDDLEKPFALAVSPVHKYMFWSDVGSTKKIERASLSGDNRKVIIANGLAFPISIAIDYSANKLVWADSERDSVETSDLDGTSGSRKVIRRLSHSEFYDVAVFRDMIGVTNLQNGSLVIINKNTGAVVNSLTKKTGDPFVAIALYSADTQLAQVDLCQSKGCSDICVNENNGPVCMCKEGFKLNQDGVSCLEDLGKFHRALMWSNSSDICMIDIRSLTTNSHVENVDCFFQDGTSITYFDIDMSERKVVFVDGRTIYSANIGQIPSKHELIATTKTVTGIAVDWRDNNVYWCMGTTNGSINLVSQETLNSYNLVNKDLTYPKDLNILPFHDAMFWISGTSGAYKIERSELSGSERRVLCSGGSLVNPKGLTVDFSTYILYFIDDGHVKSCDIDGTVPTTLQPNSAFISPKMVLTYQNYLIVADSAYPSPVLKIFQKKSEPELKHKLEAIDVEDMTDIKVLDALLQPDQIGPCDILNGDCEQICLPIGRNRICQCEYGFQLDSNKESCSSTALTNNFLLVTDWTHNQMYQISLVNDDVIAVDTDTYGSPIGVVYNHEAQQVIWNTNTLVHRISLNGTGYKVILNTEMLGCHADRFAIDYPSGNIYYTANPVLITGFIGIGIISSDGLHKRLISSGVRPRAIVLDPERGLLFWTDHGHKPAFVKKANMDGSNIQTVVQSGLGWPNGLAIDTKESMLYVTDGQTNVIHKCTYIGVCTEYYTDSGAHLMDIELLGDYLYYTAWNRPYVTKIHKSDPSIISRVGYKPELGRLDAVSLYSSTATSTAVSLACKPNHGRGPCSTFCLPTPSGYTCSCEDGVELLGDGKTCENAKTTSTITTTTPTTTTTSTTTTTTTSTTTSTSTAAPTTTTITQSAVTDKLGGHPVPVIAGVSTGFIVLVAIVVVLVIVMFQRSKKKRRDSSGSQQATSSNQYGIGFDISYITTPPPVERQRPDTTYDFITFDEPETDSSKVVNDNDRNDYMSLYKPENDYEKLSLRRKPGTEPSQNLRPSAKPNEYKTMPGLTKTGSAQTLDDYLTPVTNDTVSLRQKPGTEPSQNFRPSAKPNEYQTMSALTKTGSAQTLDDYLTPVTQGTVADEEFNNPFYNGDSVRNNGNPFLNELNSVSTISYTPQQ